MVRICFLQDSEFFRLIEEKFISNELHNVNIVTNKSVDMILIDYENLILSDLLRIIPLYEDEKVILFTDKHCRLDFLSLLRHGVDSIFYKSKVVLDQLPEVLEKIQHGEFFLPLKMTESFIEKIVQLKNSEHDRFLHQVQDVECHLTLKQAEVAALMKQGHSNKEIASLLGISEGSVKVHVSQVYSKLGVKDRNFVKELLNNL